MVSPEKLWLTKWNLKKKKEYHLKGDGKSLEDFKQDSDNQIAIQNSNLTVCYI